MVDSLLAMQKVASSNLVSRSLNATDKAWAYESEPISGRNETP